MRALIVHGMGRTPLAAAQLAYRLGRAGVQASLFGYVAAFQDFDAIASRLGRRLERLAASGPYIVVGHSLGGLLLRAALAKLPTETPLPAHLFLVGSPHRSPRLARRLRDRCLFRLFSGDSGRMLADPSRMRKLPFPDVPVTVIAGTAGFPRPFRGRTNDGIVTVGEAHIGGVELVPVSAIHTFLLNSGEVFQHILDRAKDPKTHEGA
ncbi:MAG: alpha/beta hydrolase [Holophagaceae bacterium]|nr:alpha/beta hydrolase [Holophagaceae bacterium]